MAGAHKIDRDDLTFVKQIGEGGFSTVFEMLWQKNGNQRVAVKRLHKVDKREVDILLKLEHTNIVQLLGVVDKETDYMLVLEYCDGGSLRGYLDEHSDQPLTPQLFYDWAEQAAKPVKYLKQMHIIHKDIKSSNYLITKDSILKLADFGLAKKIEATIKNATESATYAYMAPELVIDNILSPSYDIFALAVVLWELWTRQVPFQGKEYMNILWVVCAMNERLSIPQDCPKILAELMEQCWVSERKDRPGIEEVLSTIQKARTLATYVHEHDQQFSSISLQDLSNLSLGGDNDEEILTPTPAMSLNISPFLKTEGSVSEIDEENELTPVPMEPSSNIPTFPTSSEPEQLATTLFAPPDLKVADVELPQQEVEEDQQASIGSWRLERSLGKQRGPGELINPCGIVETPDGQIAVADMLDPNVNFYNKDGTFTINMNTNRKPDNRTKRDVANASIAVGPDGKIFIADCTYFVKVFKQKDKNSTAYLGMLLTASPENIPSDADGDDEAEIVSVKVDDQGRLLVGERASKYIGIHESHDGQPVRSISLQIEPLSLACTSQDTIIVSNAISDVQIIDYFGAVLCILCPPGLYPGDEAWIPRGVACHGDMIAVCNYYSKGVPCFSQTGNYLGSIATDEIVCRDAEFVEGGNKLLISGLGCVQMYARILKRVNRTSEDPFTQKKE